MQNLKLVSEDQRRRLFEFGEGNWKIAKYVEVKEDCVIGDHYHENKDECFLLIEGEMEIITGYKNSKMDIVNKVTAPDVVDVPRNMYHSFNIKAGSKLIGLCSELFNKDDDHK